MINLSRWHPFEAGSLMDQINDWQKDMNRLFNRWGKEGARLFGVERVFPALNMWEKDDTFHVEAELPGLELKDLELYVTGGNQLRIKAERRPPEIEKCTWLRQERGFGSFARLIDLPYPVDAERIEANLENGVLHVKLPKHESVRPRKIEVRGE